MKEIQGSFAVQMEAGAPYSQEDGITVAPATFEKTFSGPLEAKSTVWFLSARTPVPTSATYVAIERVVGTLDGQSGTFLLQHSGRMHGDVHELTLFVVPDSATGGLQGLTGEMEIDIRGGEHFYTMRYQFPAA